MRAMKEDQERKRSSTRVLAATLAVPYLHLRSEVIRLSTLIFWSTQGSVDLLQGTLEHGSHPDEYL